VFVYGDSGKMPFEDRLLKYIAANPGKTTEDASRDLGVGAAALAVALLGLEEKGLVEYRECPAREED
jgi:DNA-binding MarR family transcriptional regulator